MKVMGVGSRQGCLDFVPKIFFKKFDVQIYRCWCILTVIDSLVLTPVDDLNAFRGTQKSVMSKPHGGKWGFQRKNCPASPVAWEGGGGAGGWKPHGPMHSPM